MKITTANSILLAASSALAIPLSTSTSAVQDDRLAIRAPAASTGFLYGVNIGNWLILEKWMDTTGLFTGAFANVNDQWNFDSTSGAQSALTHYWDTYFTQADVNQIASWGFNALRIPIGYWAYTKYSDPYLQGADAYLEKALGWARSAGMKVLIDLHGSPGSQNGEAHSGHIGNIEWQVPAENLNRSTDVLLQIAKKYGTNAWADVVWGIETVNEPATKAPNKFSVSKQWSKDAWTAITNVIQNKNCLIFTHDSYLGPKNFIPVGSGLGTFGVDTHEYQLYTDAINTLDQTQHIQHACGWASDLATTKASIPMIVGEWSALTNVCVNPDGTSSAGKTCTTTGCQCTSAPIASWNQNLKDAVRKYVEAQLDVYQQNTNGYFLWSYKGPGGWDLKNLISGGIFPQPLTSRKFPSQCS